MNAQTDASCCFANGIAARNIVADTASVMKANLRSASSAGRAATKRSAAAECDPLSIAVASGPEKEFISLQQ